MKRKLAFALAILIFGIPITALSAEQSEPQAASSETEQDMSVTVLPAGPERLETLIERRRDMLNQRRELAFDLITGRKFLRSPLYNAWDEVMNRYADAQREYFRRRSDYFENIGDARRRLLNPWGQYRKDLIEHRNNMVELEMLDRREWRDDLMLARARAFYARGPYGYPDLF